MFAARRSTWSVRSLTLWASSMVITLIVPLKATTTVAVVANGAVVVGVDSRASMGAFVGSHTTLKVIPVTDHILGTMAGGAADCSFWLRRLAAHARLVETDTGRRLSVGSAARLLSSTLQDQRGQGLSVGTMLMGVEMRRVEDDDRLLPRDNDEECCQGVLYYIDSDGSRVKDQYFAVGSGSTFAYGILDNGFKEGLSVDDAAGLCARAVSHAAYRDAYSGGFCNIFVVNKHGWRHLRHFDQGIGSIDAQTVQ